MSSSPTMAGWRMVWHEPALVLGEIVWRWTSGLIVVVVLTFGLMVYLSTIEVSAASLWLISTREPAAIAAAFLYMLRDSGWAATRISLVALPPLAVLWIVAASIGRAATLQPMLGVPGSESAPRQRGRWRGIAGLNLLRFTVWLAANIACAGWLVIAFTATSDPGLSLLLFITVTTVVLVIWAGLNWLLSVAAIFAVRNQADTFESISLAIDLLWRRFSPLLVTSSAWGIVRGIAVSAEIFMLAGVLSFAGRVAPGVLLITALLSTLAYLAFSDLLYIGRLASYLAIIETEDEASPEAPVPAPAPEYPPDVDWSKLTPEHPA